MTTVADPRAKQKRYYKKNPEKLYAHCKIGDLVHRGKMKPAKELQCSNCDNQARVYHHPNGYGKDHILDVIPLCQSCHIKEHYT